MRVAAGFIENDSGELLLSLRPKGKSLAGYWELPGGKIEPGEMAFEALVRELREELCLEVSLIDGFGIYESAEVDLHMFRVRALGAPQRTEANEEIRWFKPELALDLRLVPADVQPLKDYLEATNNPSGT